MSEPNRYPQPRCLASTRLGGQCVLAAGHEGAHEWQQSPLIEHERDLADEQPTLAEADAERRAADTDYAAARELMADGRSKAAEVAVASAIDHEREADRLELLARRAMMSEAQ